MAAFAATFALAVKESRLVRTGLVLLAVGWTPLLLYVLYESFSGRTGGNPIGLGLLLFFSTPIASVLILVGVVVSAIAARSTNG